MTKKFIRTAALALMTATSALALQPARAATDAAAVVKHYAAVAHAKYEDALTTAEALDKAVDAQKKGKTTVLEMLVTKELGDPFRRDALKKPRRLLDKYKHTNVA